MARKVARITIEHQCSEEFLSITAAAATTFPAAANNKGGNTTIRCLQAQLATE